MDDPSRRGECTSQVPSGCGAQRLGAGRNIVSTQPVSAHTAAAAGRWQHERTPPSSCPPTPHRPADTQRATPDGRPPRARRGYGGQAPCVGSSMIWCGTQCPPPPPPRQPHSPAPRPNSAMTLGRLALTPTAFPWLAGMVGVALITCFVMHRTVQAALHELGEGGQGGYFLRGAPRRIRRRRLMGWEGGYFLRSEIKKERTD